MSNYETLVNILDQIRKEAPSQYKTYYPLESETEKIDQARSRAFIHLYLKVKFGLLDFIEREKNVVDGTNDGGIDGYYIDKDNKVIYLLQSKFRISEIGFQEKEIQLTEILKIDADRIVKGETCYENGTEYNSKIKNMLKEIQNVPDIAVYDYKIIILANLKGVTASQIKKLVGGLPAEVVNFERCYKELVFPIVSGTYYSATDVYVYMDLTTKSLGSKIRYIVDTEFRKCEITVVFVPTIEIAKVMNQYKNSILKYNPRSYLDLSTNAVNLKIAKTMREINTNEFALFNNGITFLSDQTQLTEQTGLKNIAQLKLTNPQIINGGQTAYTLSKIFQDGLSSGDPEKHFRDKEVLLRIITFFDGDESGDSADKLSLIESISKATNEQTVVTEADRRSNDKVQIGIQSRIFNEFGLFYERKRGEFWNGRQDGYIDQKKIINREHFLRICIACNGMPSQARRNSERILFGEDRFYSTLYDLNRLREYYFGYACYDVLNDIQRQFSKVPHNRFGIVNYGNALRYGKFAVISVCCTNFNSKINNRDSIEKAKEAVNQYLDKWLDYEKHIASLGHNVNYFTEYVDEETGRVTFEVNYDNYYKGRTLNSDLKTYFKI